MFCELPTSSIANVMETKKMALRLTSIMKYLIKINIIFHFSEVFVIWATDSFVTGAGDGLELT